MKNRFFFWFNFCYPLTFYIIYFLDCSIPSILYYTGSILSIFVLVLFLMKKNYILSSKQCFNIFIWSMVNTFFASKNTFFDIKVVDYKLLYFTLYIVVHLIIYLRALHSSRSRASNQGALSTRPAVKPFKYSLSLIFNTFNKTTKPIRF